MKYYVYILLCSDSTLYTGYTNDIKKRIKIHNSGKGAKYTRGRLPVQLLYKEILKTEGEAKSREFEIKKMKRNEKIEEFRLKL